MIKKIVLIAFVLLFANITFSQTDGISFKNDAKLKLNSSIKDYSKSSFERTFERKILEDTLITPMGAYEVNKLSTLTFDSTYVPKKNYLLPIGEVILFNGLVWSMSAYVVPAPWAKISIKSVEENWKHQWVWDSDHFRTNQFSHPIHGAMFFNFARSSGLTFLGICPVFTRRQFYVGNVYGNKLSIKERFNNNNNGRYFTR